RAPGRRAAHTRLVVRRFEIGLTGSDETERVRRESDLGRSIGRRALDVPDGDEPAADLADGKLIGPREFAQLAEIDVALEIDAALRCLPRLRIRRGPADDHVL